MQVRRPGPLPDINWIPAWVQFFFDASFSRECLLLPAPRATALRCSRQMDRTRNIPQELRIRKRVPH